MTPIVLFVDDDPLLLQGLVRSLSREPYEIRCAHSGDEALALLNRGHVDIMVSDEQMPGQPGSELIAQVHAEFPHILSLLMTGHATVGSLMHALNHGHVFRVLLKPCRTDEIISAIRLALLHQTIWNHCREALPLMRQMGDLLAEVGRVDAHRPRAPALSPKDASGHDLSDLAAALDAELEHARNAVRRT